MKVNLEFNGSLSAAHTDHVDQRVSSLPDILLILRKAPVGNTKLKLLRNRRINLLHHLKRDMECHLLG